MTAVATETRIKFVAVPGAHLSVQSAQKYGEELYRLHTEEQMPLTAENVVKEARERGSPLNDAFEWNNHMAATQYRLQQARKLLQSIAFMVQESPEAVPEPIRFFGCIPTEEGGEEANCYIPMPVIHENPDMEAKLLRIAARELSAFRRKYGRLQRLGSIVSWEGLEELLEEVA